MTGAYQFLKKNGVAIGFGTGTVLAILTYGIILGGYPEFNPTTEDLYKLPIFDFGLYTTYALIVIASLAVVLFSSLYVIKNPKESVKGLIGFGVMAVLFIVTYSMGDGTLTEGLINSDPSLLPLDVKFEDGVTQSGDVQMADGLIKFSYAMLLLSGLAILFAIGRDFIKQS